MLPFKFSAAVTEIKLLAGPIDDGLDGFVSRGKPDDFSLGRTLLIRMTVAVTLRALDGVQGLEETLGRFVIASHTIACNVG